MYRSTTWPTYYKLYLQKFFNGNSKQNINHSALHFNEVIPENQPVHLYMDIDVALIGSSPAQFQQYVEKLDLIVKQLCKSLENFIMARFNIESVYAVFLTSHQIPLALLLAGGYHLVKWIVYLLFSH